MPLCSAVGQRKDSSVPITKQLVVADVTGLGIKKTWQLKGFILDFNRLLTLNYPDILDRVLVLPDIIPIFAHYEGYYLLLTQRFTGDWRLTLSLRYLGVHTEMG